MINGAKLEITVLVDNDKVEEMRKLGFGDSYIERQIKNSIILSDKRSPVIDIQSVTLVKYY
jgi:hypothetical protein